VLESAAYRQLRGRGLCEREIIPRFFGTIEKFDPQQCQLYLNAFLDDEYPPSAIFLEYIPNLEMIQLHNYTQKRMDNLCKGIQEIHEARVWHRDPKPRNMIIVKDDPERVLWIDFDRAETYDRQITDEQKRFLDEEEEIVHDFRDCLVSTLHQTCMIPNITLLCSKPIVQKGDLMRRIYFIALD
jgi:serine/threonine protein kinase